MLLHSWLALFLLLPATVCAEDFGPASSALVRILVTRGDTTVRGTGFVVGLERDRATIVTVSHVIAGPQPFEVAFGADLTQSFNVPARAVLGMDSGDDSKGLAVFQVRGALPAGLTALGFEVENRPQAGDELFLLGFPQMTNAPRTNRRSLSAWGGTTLLIDQGVGEGFSGGPVLKAGKVVGVITSTDDQTTYAVSARVVREALEGWGVKLGGSSTSQPSLPPPQKCVIGEERNDQGMVFVRICPGTFMMGSVASDSIAEEGEKPAHPVTLSEFWIGKFEVFNLQVRRFRPHPPGAEAWPVTEVSWGEAQEACHSFGGRLPTEAEWEYAARAGTKSPWSVDARMLGQYAWYGEKLGCVPHPAGKKAPSAWGLHDIFGNVDEWVADWSGPYSSEAQTNPLGPLTGSRRVARGGACIDSANMLRPAARVFSFPPDFRSEYIGFRCARDADPRP